MIHDLELAQVPRDLQASIVKSHLLINEGHDDEVENPGGSLNDDKELIKLAYVELNHLKLAHTYT